MDLATAPDAEAKTDTSDCDSDNDTHVAQGEDGYVKSGRDDVASEKDTDSSLVCDEPAGTPK